MIHYSHFEMNESNTPPTSTQTTRLRRKALADWFLETSSLVVVFLLCEPALKSFQDPAPGASPASRFWYYAIVLPFGCATFALGMRLQRDP